MGMVSKNIKIFFGIPCSIILFQTIYLILKYYEIPDTIQIHNNGSVGNKIYLFLSVGINLIILFFIWYLIKNPHKINQPYEVNEVNKELIFRNIQIFLVCLAIIITIIFCFVN
jgi:hypothetical protein